jgi:beta-N-acetylhexosaminidase
MTGIAQRSITLVRNNDHVLPLARNSGRHVLVTGWGVSSTTEVAGDLTNAGLTVQRLWTGSPNSSAIAAAVAAAKNNDVTVVLTDNAWSDTTQQNLVAALLAAGKPVVVAAVGGPYDLSYFPAAPTYLAAYGYQPTSLDALAATITGANPTGRLPVTIPNAADTATLVPYGTGLHY